MQVQKLRAESYPLQTSPRPVWTWFCAQNPPLTSSLSRSHTLSWALPSWVCSCCWSEDGLRSSTNWIYSKVQLRIRNTSLCWWLVCSDPLLRFNSASVPEEQQEGPGSTAPLCGLFLWFGLQGLQNPKITSQTWLNQLPSLKVTKKIRLDGKTWLFKGLWLILYDEAISNIDHHLMQYCTQYVVNDFQLKL